MQLTSRPFSQRTVHTAWAIWSDGWIWLTLVLFRSTICLILLRVIGKSQWARWWNMTDQSQPNPTQLSDQIVHPAVHVNMDLSAQCCKCNPKLKFGISAPAGHGRPTESGSEPQTEEILAYTISLKEGVASWRGGSSKSEFMHLDPTPPCRRLPFVPLLAKLGPLV